MISIPMILTIITFSVIMIYMYKARPKILFDKDTTKPFGVGNGKTLIPFPVLSILIAVMLYSIFFYIAHTNSNDNNINGINGINESIGGGRHIDPTQTYTFNPMTASFHPITMHNVNTPYPTSGHNQPFTYKVVKARPDGTILM